MEKREKYLPIGTVLKLKGATKRLMITGFCIISDRDTEKMWDYSGCLYPEGMLSPEETVVFDHSQIEEIYYMGYSEDEEEKQLKDKLNQLLKSEKIK